MLAAPQFIAPQVPQVVNAADAPTPQVVYGEHCFSFEMSEFIRSAMWS